jgi:hypothetical protein
MQEFNLEIGDNCVFLGSLKDFGRSALCASKREDSTVSFKVGVSHLLQSISRSIPGAHIILVNRVLETKGLSQRQKKTSFGPGESPEDHWTARIMSQFTPREMTLVMLTNNLSERICEHHAHVLKTSRNRPNLTVR